MLPPWLLAAFYIVSGVVVVWLLFRIWQRRQGDPLEPASRDVAPLRPADPSPRRAYEMAPKSPPPAIPALVKAQSNPPVSPPVSGLTVLKESSARPDSAQPSWERSSLLQPPAALAQPLPHLRPDDIPSVRTDDYAFGDLTPALASLLPDSETRQVEVRKELQQAGYYQPHALQNLSAVRYVLMMLGLVLGGVALILSPPRFEWIAFASVVVLPLLGWALPRLYVRGQAEDRKRQIELGMPDLLDMLNMCVSQGLTIPDSLRRIIRDLRGPYPALAQELRIVTEQSSLAGLPTALSNFSQRADLPEVHSFASLLTQTERMGTSITDALTSYSDTMRESLRQRADEKGNRATFRLLFPTVFCLMPAVYLFLLGPAIVELSNFFYRGGRDALDTGTSAIERLNQMRRGGPVPADRLPR